MSNILAELRRRNVFRVAAVYAVVGWILMQVGIALETSLNLPEWFDTLITVLVLLGFPVAIIFAWAFEMTPEGVKRTEDASAEDSVSTTTGRKLNLAIFGALTLVAALVVGNAVIKRGGPDSASQSASITAEDSSIAVLPFENFSTDPDQDYFASGISEELLNALAKIEGLKVSSRTSAFAFKGQEKPIAEIAAALNVAHVLEGSVRKSGNTLRITAQLIDTKTDVHLWSETYDRALTTDNIFDIQDEITAAIVGELRGQMNFVAEQNDKLRANSVEAFELYLRARDNTEKRRHKPMHSAVTDYEQVIELDPNFVPAYAGLAENYLLMFSYGAMDYEQAIASAKPLVVKALELSPNSAEALAVASLLADREGEPEKALGYAEKAVAANSNYAIAYLRKGLALEVLGQLDNALATYEKALELDPLSAFLRSAITSVHFEMGDFDKAREAALENIRWNPDSQFGHSDLGEINFLEGDYSAGHQKFKDAQARDPAQRLRQGDVFSIYLNTGLVDRAREIAVSPYQTALVHLLTGDLQKSGDLFDVISDPAEKIRLAYSQRDYAKALAFSEPFLEFIYPEGKPVPNSEQAAVAARYAFAFQKVGDARAERFTKLVDEFIGDRQPEDLAFQIDLTVGAALQIIKGNPEGAYAWFNEAFKTGAIAKLNLEEPIFDPVRETAEFKAIIARNDTILARHRLAIEEQLANPDPKWVTPETRR